MIQHLKIMSLSTQLKDGNKFGRGIEFREGASVQLLKYNENGNSGQILLNPEALNILREINEPLSIISVGEWRISIYIK